MVRRLPVAAGIARSAFLGLPRLAAALAVNRGGHGSDLSRLFPVGLASDARSITARRLPQARVLRIPESARYAAEGQAWPVRSAPD